jgi:hypothetical protein
VVEVVFVKERVQRMREGRLMRPKMAAKMPITGFGKSVNEGGPAEAMEESWREGGLYPGEGAWAAYLRMKYNATGRNQEQSNRTVQWRMMAALWSERLSGMHGMDVGAPAGFLDG